MDIVHPGLLGLVACRTLDTSLSRSSCRLMAFQVVPWVKRKMAGSITIGVDHQWTRMDTNCAIFQRCRRPDRNGRSWKRVRGNSCN